MVDKNVMNKYIPPDFDPNKLLPMRVMRPKRKAGPHEMSIRMMMPFTMRCGSCGNYMHIATKFNSRCSKVAQNALGLDIYRFYGPCKHCLAEFCFRTDPENSDYILESGGTRTYEAFKDADYAEAEIAKQRADANEDEDKAMEHKIYDTAEEMRRLDELDQLKSLNKREALRYDAITNALDKLYKDEDTTKRLRAEEEDAAEYQALLAESDGEAELVISEEIYQENPKPPQSSFLVGYSSSED
jgi:Saf4/Yju2 protein